ncbi:Starch-binding associating with outer membrane [Parapedobacter luteus]|uniref:Starch-binding associating with outer membrane n=1 Tax=Parapedobacter luteus TaxID=623280 RepID=A0A1T5AL62_9SPHI|nr:SusD/RagB family nutrient-binding outer membrane lipoprotein [Parapedobacter luteus]SKB35625.1 Starch-binding associating with outer membrane [Parapedobacter luteus]
MKHIFRVAVFSGLSILAASCDSFLDVNVNPNAPVNENLTLASKLPAALNSTATQEVLQLNQLGAFWGGYWGTTSEALASFNDIKYYDGIGIRGSRDGIQIWENTYNILLYYKLIKDQAETEQAGFYAGISKIMMGWHFMRLVDIYNNVPFDEALQGTNMPQPTYQSGQEVYQKSIDLITEGILDIKSASVAPASDDIFFAGNRTLWAKFGNTVKLRALLQQSEVSSQSGYISAEIQKIIQEGSGFLGIGENAYCNPGYLNTAGKMNPFYETYYRNAGGATVANHTNIRPTEYLIEKYQALNDPRLDQLYLTASGSYKGVRFGNPVAADEYNADNTSALKGPVENGNQPAGLLKSFNQSTVILSSFESLFLQAEAAERGWIDGAAATFYRQAVAESFAYIGLSGSEAETYTAQPAVALGEAGNRIARIIEQKWLAINSINSFQAWNDFRRLGLPDFPNSESAPSADARPLRLMYPETELQTNRDEVNRQGGDNITSDRVWWDID